MSNFAAGGAAAGTAILPGIGTAVGAIGGGIIDFLGNQSANEENRRQFDETMAFNKEMLTSARQYNTEMANTAHQREMADLRKAGINPMMTAMGGNGAPSPVSPTSTQGVGNAAKAPQIGAQLASAIPSALSAANTLAAIKNADADTILKKANAIEASARTQQATSNAKQADEMTKQIARGQDAYAAEADARKNKASIEIKNAATDKLLEQLVKGSSIGSNAVDMIKSLLNGASYKKGRRDGRAEGLEILQP